MKKAAGWKRPPACSPWSELLPTRRVHQTPTGWKQSKVNTNIKGRFSPLFLGDPIIPQVRVCTAQSTAVVPVFRGAYSRLGLEDLLDVRPFFVPRRAETGKTISSQRQGGGTRPLSLCLCGSGPWRGSQLPKHHVDNHQRDRHHAGPECRPGKQRIGAFRRQRRPLLQ